MRVLLASLVALVLALMLALPAQAKRWPSPPSWWLNSPNMVCVRLHESGNGRGSSNLYGMLEGWGAAGGSGSARYASRAEQHYRAWLLWKRYGCHAPWGRYDGCC